MEFQSYDINQPRETLTRIHNMKNHHIFKRGWMFLIFLYEKKESIEVLAQNYMMQSWVHNMLVT
jgi:hypothetical protein